MKQRTGWVWAAVIVAMTGLVVWALAGTRNAAPPGAPQGGGAMGGMPVEAAAVRVDSLMDRVAAVGTLQANESVLIRSELAGRVTEINLTEGRSVAKGAVLFRIDAAELAAQLKQIAAAVELNRANYQRALPLTQENLISPQAFDQLESRLKESEASLAVAQQRLSKATIRAPFAGRVGLRQISPGDYLQPGQALVNLEDLSRMKVDFRVPGIQSGRVVPGQQVDVEVDAFPGRTFVGAVSAVDPRLDVATRSILVRASVPNPRGELRPGMFAQVNVTLAERPNALLIPEEAVVPMGTDKFVFRIVEGKAALTKVTLGQRRPGEVEVVSGLASRDTVVTAGQMKLRDGVPVTIADASPGPAAQNRPAPAED